MSPYAAVPYQLTGTPNWVVWKYETRDGKDTKVPYDAKSNGERVYAKVNDPSTWTNFQRAVEVADILSGHDYDGVGFMLHGTHFVGFDFDGILQDGSAEPFVLDILEKLGDPYCEITPSGNGLRVFVECLAALPVGGRKFSRNNNGKYGAEIYSGSEGGRYLTVTGNKFSGNAIPKIGDLSLVYFMVSQITNAKLKSLWMGDLSAYDGDESRADLALLGILARLFNNDAAKMEWAFSASEPGTRDKWAQRKDYRDRTIRKAISGESPKTRAEGPHPADSEELKNNNPSSAVLDFSLPAVEGTHRDYVIEPITGKDGWFPLGAPSVVAASSGGGKTTWILDMLQAQERNKPFFGHGTNGLRYLILMYDRGKFSQQRTLERMGIDENSIPIKYLPITVGGVAVQAVIRAIEETTPMPKVVFLEGVDMLVKDVNKPEFVIPFLYAMQALSEYYHLAVIMSVGAPKIKRNEGYIAKRDCILGSEKWGRMCETVATLEYIEGDDIDERRYLFVLPRNNRAERFNLKFNESGRLAIDNTVAPVECAHKTRADIGFYRTWTTNPQNPNAGTKAGQWFSAMDVETVLGTSHSTTAYRIKDAITKKLIVPRRAHAKKHCHGGAKEYRWNESGGARFSDVEQPREDTF